MVDINAGDINPVDGTAYASVLIELGGGSKTYWIIKTCLDGAECTLPPSTNITKSTPVTSLSSNETYISIQCALCNEEKYRT